MSGVALAAWLLSRPDARLADFLSEAAGRHLSTERPRRTQKRLVWLLSGALVWLAVRSRLGGPWSALLPCLLGTGGVLQLAEASRARRKVTDMRAEWPALLESMAIGALSGLDLAAAFATAAGRVTGPLKQEAEKAVVRISGGVSVSRALAIMSQDGVPGAERLRTVLLQSEVLGTPAAETLRGLAMEASALERQEAEARFNALPLRLSVITVVFLLPPVLVVSIAPHMLVFINSRW